MSKKYRGVILDAETFGHDVSLSSLKKLDVHWDIYPFTVKTETLKRCCDADIIVSNKVTLHRTLVLQLKRTRLIAIAATGMNNVDLETCAEQGIQVCNVTNYCSNSVAEHVFSLIFALNKQLIPYRQSITQNAWAQSRQFCLLDYPLRELNGLTMAIMGYGNLGKAVAHKARLLGLKVLLAERKGTTRVRQGRISFDHAIKKADIISLHLPLNEQTHNLIDHQEFNMMKKDALLINTARGGLVNEEALLQALKKQRIGGAGFDVLSREPPPKDHPLVNYQGSNFILTPHIAWASQSARQTLIDKVAANIQQFT